MAINKRKALSAARKFAQKGAKEKALKECNSLLKADPRDAKLRLEVGDAYRRWGQLKDAITQYERVAEQYKDEGFDARAVAVLKQILNLDPKRHVAFVSLSELYQRIGLEAEAIGALQSAADGYREEGDTREALELLRRMAALDPGNTTSRIKVADLLCAEGMKQDAVAEYEAVIAELQRVGANDSIPRIYERILEVMPERTDLLTVLSRELLEQGDSAGAEAYARRACEADSNDPEKLELLAEVYEVAGRTEDLADTTRQLAQLFRSRGDEDRAREIMQRLPSSAFDAGQSQSDLGPSAEEFAAKATAVGNQDGSLDEGEELLLEDDELLGDEEYLEGRNTDFDLGDSAPDLDTDFDSDLGGDLGDERDAGPEESSADAPPAPVPQGDPDQLLAEASVYLRYGKRDQARASLDAALAQLPEHRGVLDKLGELHAEDGESAKAVDAWERSARLALAADDTDGFKVVRDRIAAIDADAANALPDPTPTPDVQRPEVADEEVRESAAESLQDIEFDIDIDLDVDIEIDEGPGEELSEPASDSSDSGGEASETAVEIDSSEGAGIPDVAANSISQDSGSKPATGASASLSATASQQISEDLEEAEFYFQQELYDEAEAIYQRVLTLAPNHPSAMVRLGELAAARGEDPSSVDEEAEAGDVAPLPEGESVESPDDEFEIEIEGLDLSEPEGSASGAEEALSDAGLDDVASVDDVAQAAGESQSVDARVAGSGKSGESGKSDEMVESAESVGDSDDLVIEIDLDDDDENDRDESSADGGQGEAAEVVEIDASEPDEPDKPDCAEESEASSARGVERADAEVFAAADDEESFDLAAELREALEEDDAAAAGHAPSTLEDGIASVFSEFKKGVSQTLSAEDHETRYDLGIAYREMGLLPDAVAEFRLCLDSPGRRIDSLQMLGLCSIDDARGSEAVGYLEQALASADVEPERQAGLYFDLGRAFELLGDISRASAAYASIEDSSFPGLAERLAAVEQAAEPDSVELMSPNDAVDAEPEDAQEEQFESFDDMVAEVEAMTAIVEHAAPAVETEDESSAVAEPATPEAIVEPEEAIVEPAELVVEPEEAIVEPDEPVSEPDTATDSKKKKRPRKRKISFV